MRLIDADELKKAITEATYNFEQIPIRVDKVQEIIDNAPTECEKYRSFCMAKQRPQAKTNADLFKQTFGIYATEIWSMSENQFLEWLNTEVEE